MLPTSSRSAPRVLVPSARGTGGTSPAFAAGDGRLLDVDVRRLNNDEVVNLAQTYAGKVVLVVNTASKCAFTGQ